MKPTFHRPAAFLVRLALVCIAFAPIRAFSQNSSRDPLASKITSQSDWTRFRGPNGSGLSNADIPAQWTDKDILWKTTLPGGGHSSPVVWQDRIFLLCGDDATGDRMLTCVNAGDGSIRWNKKYPSHTYHHHEYNSYASNSAAVDAQRVYICWSTPEEFSVLAFDHDGKELWKTDLGAFISQHGGGQSPIVAGDRVFVGGDQEGPASFLYALSAETGQLIWKVARGHTDKFSASTPCVFQPVNGKLEIIFTSKKHGFTAVDPVDGHTIWEINNIFDSRAVSSPYVADGLIFGSCGDGPMGHQFAAIKPSEDGQSAKMAYMFKKVVPYVPTSIVVNGLLFYVTDNGIMRCLKADTGEIVWTQRMDENFFGSIVCAKDKLFMLSKEGDMYVVAASDHFQQLGRNELKLEDENVHLPPLSTTPAISGGKMYVRTYTHLICVGGK